MNIKNDGGRAFPTQCTYGTYGPRNDGQAGMSQRDYFAGQALSALRVGDWSDCHDAAKWCYDMADAMLKERDK